MNKFWAINILPNGDVCPQPLRPPMTDGVVKGDKITWTNYMKVTVTITVFPKCVDDNGQVPKPIDLQPGETSRPYIVNDAKKNSYDYEYSFLGIDPTEVDTRNGTIDVS